jgi:cobalt-zinc-cadmium efflux system membrane fusion protein
VIPSQAVSLLRTKQIVMVQTQPGLFERRDVTLSYQSPKETVVSSGLEAGEQVVSQNMLLLAREFRSAQDDALPASALEKKEPVAPAKNAQAATKTTADPKADMKPVQAKP